MPDTGYWTFPPDRITRGSGVRYELTVLNPPFTVEVADLGLRNQSDTITVATRADLDLVRVGA
ncbi:hypothetical protein [Streptomyces nigrescens]|uniref:Uncharacterized protein n=1 Tax=Streptomyces nigrescens TaxID=1920 RepID=A0A640TLM1_STRNI|nr:hypothetical protein [Streptomyces libani]WAT98453.1 hypothetical protein STRLI_004515 [Streptomyces libani subsp. libani]GFE24070.1 hypothetical protein Sliba_45230 [Streptomyces libani subsp. libani]